MSGKAHFQVDSRLAILLGDTYRSTEQALKELVDNAWDAEADHIWITLPNEMTTEAIVLKDDGSGMTEQEVSSEYLFVANDRRSRKGDLTASKRRKVKGRKGIGKFAGLMAASVMRMETKARGVSTTFIVDKKQLLEAGRDIEQIPLELQTSSCPTEEHGTCITLSELDQHLSFPVPDKLKQILIHEYGRETDFKIFINDKALGIEDISGRTLTQDVELAGIGNVRLHFTISDSKRPPKNPGIVIRVGGKAIGKPQFFGLDKADDFPIKLLSKIYGEVEANGLADDVTADWGAIIENSKAFETLQQWVEPQLREEVEASYGREVSLAQARLQQRINKRLAQLPEHKREFAEKAIKKVLQKFYDESEERMEPIVSVILDAIERDDYRYVLERIDEAKNSDIATFADALEEFGLVEMALISRQATERLRFLDYLDSLASNPDTLEEQIHASLENSLWVLGSEYSLMSSNKTLRRVIEEHLDKKYLGKNATKRPDLLLANNVLGQHLLIEFKRPSHTLDHQDYLQATSYRHELAEHLRNIKVIVIGGRRGQISEYQEPNVEIMAFKEVFSKSRTELDWLIKELQSQ